MRRSLFLGLLLQTILTNAAARATDFIDYACVYWEHSSIGDPTSQLRLAGFTMTSVPLGDHPFAASLPQYIGTLRAFGLSAPYPEYGFDVKLGDKSYSLKHSLTGSVTKRKVGGHTKWGVCTLRSDLTALNPEEPDANPVPIHNLNLGQETVVSNNRTSCETLALPSRTYFTVGGNFAQLPSGGEITYACSFAFHSTEPSRASGRFE
ncbi:MAG: hypothetical protein U0136_05915 [Bdellovibrionota bacterium]